MANDRNARLVYSTGAGRVTTAREEEPARPASAPGGKSGIRLRLDRRASGRVVTLVSGVTGTSAEVQALARELRTSCGTGGTVRDDTIELQGDHRDRVEAELSRRGLRSRRAGG
jgi:translation initiation factor 1